MTTAVPFRFDRAAHSYTDLVTGEVFPSITQILEASGLVDSTWYSEASRRRGSAVHDLTRDYDLGVLGLAEAADAEHYGYLAAYAKAMSIMRPTILAVEEPAVHPTLRFAGRPDRHEILYGMQSVVEIKTGLPHKAHPIQTSLQAILLAPTVGIPPEAFGRFALYLSSRGRFRLERHERRGDVDEAMEIIRRCC